LIELKKVRVGTLSKSLVVEILETGVEALKLRELSGEWARVDSLVVDEP